MPVNSKIFLKKTYQKRLPRRTSKSLGEGETVRNRGKDRKGRKTRNTSRLWAPDTSLPGLDWGIKSMTGTRNITRQQVPKYLRRSLVYWTHRLKEKDFLNSLKVKIWNVERKLSKHLWSQFCS